MDVTIKCSCQNSPEAGAGWGDGLGSQQGLRSGPGPAPGGSVCKRTRGTCRCLWGLGSFHRENPPGLTGAAGQRWWGKPGMQCESQVIIASEKAEKSVGNMKLKAYFMNIKRGTSGSNCRGKIQGFYVKVGKNIFILPITLPIFLFYSKVAKALMLFASKEKGFSPRECLKFKKPPTPLLCFVACRWFLSR